VVLSLIVSEDSFVRDGLTEASGELLKVRLAESDGDMESDAPPDETDSLGLSESEFPDACPVSDGDFVFVPAACTSSERSATATKAIATMTRVREKYLLTKDEVCAKCLLLKHVACCCPRRTPSYSLECLQDGKR
jgi:hypothetical protein